MLVGYINPFSDNFFLKDFFDFITEALSYLNPFNENFIFNDMFSWLNPFSEDFIGKKITELFSDLLKSLFIPTEERITALQTTVMSKFNFIESVKIGINSFKNNIINLGNAPVLSLKLGATKYTNEMTINVIDLNWYKPYKQYGDLIITAIIYSFYLFRLFANLPNIITGVGGFNEASIALSDIKAYSKFGFGRRTDLTRHQR